MRAPLTKRQRALKERKAMKAMRDILYKYELEKDADKLGRVVQDMMDLACMTQKDIDFYKLKGTLTQYRDIVKQETGLFPEDYRRAS